MSNKHDGPYLELRFWSPIPIEVWDRLKEHPLFQQALRDVLHNVYEFKGDTTNDKD